MKNKLTVTREEARGNNGRKRRKGFQKHVYRTHGQNQRGAESSVGIGDAWVAGSDGGKIETTVLEEQFKKCELNKINVVDEHNKQFRPIHIA